MLYYDITFFHYIIALYLYNRSISYQIIVKDFLNIHEYKEIQHCDATTDIKMPYSNEKFYYYNFEISENTAKTYELAIVMYRV